jgi:hypothetical protein
MIGNKGNSQLCHNKKISMSLNIWLAIKEILNNKTSMILMSQVTFLSACNAWNQLTFAIDE